MRDDELRMKVAALERERIAAVGVVVSGPIVDEAAEARRPNHGPVLGRCNCREQGAIGTSLPPLHAGLVVVGRNDPDDDLDGCTPEDARVDGGVGVRDHDVAGVGSRGT